MVRGFLFDEAIFNRKDAKTAEGMLTLLYYHLQQL
jgi:hypothetical protein